MYTGFTLPCPSDVSSQSVCYLFFFFFFLIWVHLGSFSFSVVCREYPKRFFFFFLFQCLPRWRGYRCRRARGSEVAACAFWNSYAIPKQNKYILECGHGPSCTGFCASKIMEMTFRHNFSVSKALEQLLQPVSQFFQALSVITHIHGYHFTPTCTNDTHRAFRPNRYLDKYISYRLERFFFFFGSSLYYNSFHQASKQASKQASFKYTYFYWLKWQ